MKKPEVEKKREVRKKNKGANHNLASGIKGTQKKRNSKFT